MIEAIREVASAVREQLYERVSSPLAGAFLLAWAVWNFKLIMVILGDGTYQDKIAFIDLHLYSGADHGALRGILYPLLTALFYLYAYPIAARGVLAYHRRQKNALQALAVEIDGMKVLTLDEATRHREQHRRQLADWQSRRALLEGEVSHLISKNRELEKKLSEAETLVAAGRQSGSHEGTKVLIPSLDASRLSKSSDAAKQYVAQRGLSALEVDLLRYLHQQSVAAEGAQPTRESVLFDPMQRHALETLEELGFVAVDADNNVKVTPAGGECLTVLGPPNR